MEGAAVSNASANNSANSGKRNSPRLLKQVFHGHQSGAVSPISLESSAECRPGRQCFAEFPASADHLPVKGGDRLPRVAVIVVHIVSAARIR